MFNRIIKVFTIAFGAVGAVLCLPLLLVAFLMSYAITGIVWLFTFFLFHSMAYSVEDQQKLLTLYANFRGK